MTLMAKGWDRESLRHSAAKRFGKAPPYRNDTKMPSVCPPRPQTASITMNEDKYIDNLIGISGYESRVVVSGGTLPEKEYPFYGGGCGFAWLNGKGVAFKNYFEEENKRLKEKYGFDVFYVHKGYPSGFSVSISGDFSTLMAQKAREKIARENLPVKKSFVDYIEASAQQDMGFKEFIMNDVKKQVEGKFPNLYVETRLD